jgi:DNA-binding NtrC family response regulator
MNAPPDHVAGRRVLFVNSDISYARSCESLLQSAGFKVTLAASGRVAMDRVSHEPYSVVVLPPSLSRKETERFCAKLPGLDQEPFAFQIRYGGVHPASVVDFVKRVSTL